MTKIQKKREVHENEANVELSTKIKTPTSLPLLLTIILHTHREFSSIKSGSHTSGPTSIPFSDHFTPPHPLYIRAFVLPSFSHMHSLSFSLILSLILSSSSSSSISIFTI